MRRWWDTAEKPSSSLITSAVRWVRGFVYRGVVETVCHRRLKHQESLTAVKEQTEGGYMNGCLATELGSFQLWFPVKKRRALLSLSIQRLSPVIYQVNVHKCVRARAVSNINTARDVSTPVFRVVGNWYVFQWLILKMVLLNDQILNI